MSRLRKIIPGDNTSYLPSGTSIWSCVCLSATDDEQWRLERLRTFIAYVAGICGEKSHAMAVKIDSLEDHRGTLEVSWLIKLTPHEKYILRKAWESEFGDGGGPIVFRKSFGRQSVASKFGFFTDLSTESKSMGLTISSIRQALLSAGCESFSFGSKHFYYLTADVERFFGTMGEWA